MPRLELLPANAATIAEGRSWAEETGSQGSLYNTAADLAAKDGP